jgi:hypothetical protein
MSDIISKVEKIYRDTEILYRKLAPTLGQSALGHHIFYGPPIEKPPILFIGYQPGGRVESTSNAWPNVCEYGITDPIPYLLAGRLQAAFSPEFLRRCTGLNAIFLTSPSQNAYRKIDAEIRRESEDFSVGCVRQLISLLQPQIVVTLGFATMKIFNSEERELLNDGKICLLYNSSIDDTPAIAIRHPTGSRPRPNDAQMKIIGGYVSARLKP